MVSGMHPFTDVSAAKLRQKDFSCSRCQCFFSCGLSLFKNFAVSNFSFRQVITHKMVEFKDGRWKNVCFLCLKYGRKKVIFYLK